MFVFGKGCKALAELGPPQDCICPIQAQPQHEDLLSFAATQLCSEQCPSTEEKKKIIQTQVLGFPFQPPNHMLFNRKTADEPMTAKIHSSAMKKRVSSAVKWKRGSRGPQPARRNREGGDISHRNVVCRNLQS